MTQMNHNEIKFFGKITASITHEIQNVLSIMQESTGLMEDYFMGMQETDFPQKEKFSMSLDRIHRQINRGVDIVKTLNRFAHSPDYCPTSVDLNDLAQQMVLLSTRLSRLKNIELSFIVHQPLIIHSDPVLLQMAVFYAIEILFGVLEPGSNIILSPEKDQDMCMLCIKCTNTNVTNDQFQTNIKSSENWEPLNIILKDANCKVTLSELSIDFQVQIS